MSLGDIQLAWPWALLALPLPLLVWWFAPPVSVASRRALVVPELKPYSALSATGHAPPLRDWRWWLLSLIWLLMVAAACRPQWIGEPVTSIASGRDLMLCIDISGSMREQDLYADGQPRSRIDVVKQVAQEFVDRREGDRVGLIMFGSQAYVQTPLTFDHQTVRHFLAEAAVGLAGRSTAIGDAIGLGIKRLRDRPQQSRVLILLTDGANSAGVVEPLEAARVAAENEIRIHTIGVGAEAGGQRSLFGLRVQRSELDEQTLQAIANRTGGQYFRARDARELQSIYAAIDELEPIETDDEVFRPFIELFPWPMGSALLLLLMFALMTNLRARD